MRPVKMHQSYREFHACKNQLHSVIPEARHPFECNNVKDAPQLYSDQEPVRCQAQAQRNSPPHREVSIESCPRLAVRYDEGPLHKNGKLLKLTFI